MIKKASKFAMPCLASFLLAGMAQATQINFFNKNVPLNDTNITSDCEPSLVTSLKTDLRFDPIHAYISVAYDPDRTEGEANIMIPGSNSELQLNITMMPLGLSDQHAFNQSNPKYWPLIINHHNYGLRLAEFTTLGGKDSDQWMKNGTVLLAIANDSLSNECILISSPANL